MEDDKIELDQFHWHEALDRTYMVGDIFYGSVYEHPVIKQNPKLLEMAEDISAKFE